MKYIITEHQNEKLKRYKRIKDIVDSFRFDGIDKVEFDLDYDDKFGFYKLFPTFYVSDKHFNIQLLRTVAENELSQKIEDYLGIHIVTINSNMVMTW
jgi:hypothetical protein